MICGFKRRDVPVCNLYINAASVGISVIDFGRLDEATTCHFEIQFMFGGKSNQMRCQLFHPIKLGFAD